MVLAPAGYGTPSSASTAPSARDTLIGTTDADISHGCIRLLIPDLDLLRNVPSGSPIAITPT